MLLHQTLPAESAVVVDNRSPIRGSGAPLALCHPFPGRSLKVTSFQRQVLHATLPALASWAKGHPQWIRSFPVVRPLNGPAGARLRRSFEEGDWHPVEGLVEMTLLRESECRERFPALALEGDALVYGGGFAVHLQAWVAAMQEQDAFVEDTVVQLSREDSGWRVECEGQNLQAQRVVLACGTGMAEWFPLLQGVVEGGQLLTLRENPLPALVSRGDVHLAPSESGAVVGSTRWRVGEEKALSTDAGESHLLERTRTLLVGEATPASVWEGARYVLPSDRLPLVGPHPTAENLFVMGGFGSKGLLQSPWAAQALGRHLSEGALLPDGALPSRVDSERWVSPRVVL